jgi:FkbM family methyltransferase
MVARLLEEARPVRFLASRLLWRTGLCRMVTFDMDGDYRMRFHPSAISAALWQDRSFRREDLEVCQTILRPGDTYIDVGANVGQLAIVAARAVGETGKVVAVEAHPRTCAFLRDNVDLNWLPQIAVHNVALGEREGHISFTSMPCDDQNHVVGGALERESPGLSVPMTTLDKLWPQGHVRLLKIDAEGFELRILRGGGQVLSRCDALYIEDSGQNLARYGDTCQQVREALTSTGFRLFARDNGTLREDPPICSGNLSQNLVALHEDRAIDLFDRLAV